MAAGIPFRTLLSEITKAIHTQSGDNLATLFSIGGDIPHRLVVGLESSARLFLERQAKGAVQAPFGEIAEAHIQVLVLLRQGDDSLHAAYKEQAALTTAFMSKWLVNQSSWALPALYVLCRSLRSIAERTDEYLLSSGLQSNSICLEDCARQINKAFTIVATDRAFKGEESRQKGIYYVAGLSMKCYFKVNRPSLCKNIIRAVKSGNPQDISTYPMSHRVTWSYYLGMLSFLDEEYVKAEEHLTWAFDHCFAGSMRNLEQILSYLIPIRLLRGTLPSPILLASFPRLQETYVPFISAVKQGDLKKYDESLVWAQKRLVDMGTYLTVEKAREVCVRGLFKKAWKSMDSPSRIAVPVFQAGLGLAGVTADSAEVECMLANLIYKGYMKGYISHGLQTVVLAKTNAFPSLKTIST